MFRAILALVLILAAPAVAAPLVYTLDAEDSRVGFKVPFGPDQITGAMPVRSAEITLDFERAARSKVSVSLDVARARANFPFATQAMTGPKVLDAANHPTITFVATEIIAIQGVGAKARMAGDITIRGVTRPVVLDAEVFRPQGSAEGERGRLSVYMTGAVARSDFGATGWSDLVGDEVTLDILVRIDLAE
ncbi:MAG: YceI family protein [Paracoccaceae bacterium]|nr:YceI family protein [Paracoccaceae bacterium]